MSRARVPYGRAFCSGSLGNGACPVSDAARPRCFLKVSRLEAQLLLERYPESGNLLLRPSGDGMGGVSVTTRQTLNGCACATPDPGVSRRGCVGAWSDVGAQPDPGTGEDLGIGPEVTGCGILEAGPAPEQGYGWGQNLGRGKEEGWGLSWARGPWGSVLPGC